MKGAMLKKDEMDCETAAMAVKTSSIAALSAKKVTILRTLHQGNVVLSRNVCHLMIMSDLFYGSFWHYG